MASPAYDKFMAAIDDLRLNPPATAAVKAAGDTLHTETSEEETIQNILRHYLVMEQEEVTRGTTRETLDAMKLLEGALVRVGDEGDSIVANYRNIIAEVKARG